jgi:hypothetical protein
MTEIAKRCACAAAQPDDDARRHDIGTVRCTHCEGWRCERHVWEYDERGEPVSCIECGAPFADAP